MAGYYIGIDLGTTNCALAALPQAEAEAGAPCESEPEIFPVTQRESGGGEGRASTLPSFLAWEPGATGWEAGRRARSLAGEIPGRVITSAKSWLTHPAVDRRAGFLPYGTQELTETQRLSPVQAAAKLLLHLREKWNAAHPNSRLEHQKVAVTVPASFDPVAQQLTLEAVALAGLPKDTLLLEEPQAAFYAWWAAAGNEVLEKLASGGEASILVVDLGGGTTDFSLFMWHQRREAPLERVAVSDHILLGGDNLDLTLAHWLEERLSPGEPLPATSFARLLARCREIKEEALTETEPAQRSWPVAVAKPGASLLGGTLRTEVDGETIHRLLVEGFFPEAGAREFPLRTAAGLREVGLPYARDPAVTRHLAEFLRDRQAPDAVLFNGGTTKAPAVRQRLLSQLTSWQNGRRPVLLDNPDADLSVARGAAWYVARRKEKERIEAGAARSYYVAVGEGRAVCVLPQGTPPETPCRAAPAGLRALVGQPVSMALWQNNRRPQQTAGDLVEIDDSFAALPPLETVLHAPRKGRKASQPEVRVELRGIIRSTGILRLEMLCGEPALKWKEPWVLDFNLRRGASSAATSVTSTPADKNTAGDIGENPDTAAQAGVVMRRMWLTAVQRGEKITGNQIFASSEQALHGPKAKWSGPAVRALWKDWSEAWEVARAKGVPPAAAEEAWLQVAGFLLRPGCGVPGDAERVQGFVSHLLGGDRPAGRAVKIQRWIAARRVASGLTTEAAARVWAEAAGDWKGEPPPAELLLLAGSLEALPLAKRQDLTEKLAGVVESHPGFAAGWKALGRILSRVLVHGGADRVLPPVLVEETWRKLQALEVPDPGRSEAAGCWLRAARLTGLRGADVSGGVREAIGRLLRGWGWDESRRRILREVVPVVAADQSALFGEAPPPGLRMED